MARLPPSIERARHFIASNGGVRNTLRIALRKIRRCGVADALSAVASHAAPVPRWPQRRYRRFLRMHEHVPSASDMAAQLLALPALPRIALLATVGAGGAAGRGERGGTADRSLTEDLRSVLAQAYSEWELWLVVDPAVAEEVAERVGLLVGVAQQGSPGLRAGPAASRHGVDGVAPFTAAVGDTRIRLLVARAKQSPLEALNEALARTPAEFVARIDLQDRLAPDALLEVAKSLAAEASVDFLYTDEDRLDARGRRTAPQFKPQWSPDTLLSYAYTGDLAVFRRTLLVEVGGFNAAMSPAEDYDVALRASERAHRIVRMPRVLYHRRRPSPEGAAAAEARAKAAALARRGVAAEVEREETLNVQRSTFNARRSPLPAPGSPLPSPRTPHPASRSALPAPRSRLPAPRSAVQYAVRGAPLVSIIIPTRNHADDLRRCVQSIRERTDYPALELLIVDNGSDEEQTLQLLGELQADARIRCLRMAIPFNFSRLNNLAAREACGEVLLFLNNDTEVISCDWLERMLGFAQQSHVGAVGARLLYPDGTLQHSGVAKVGPGPTHVFGRMPEDYPHPRVQLDGNWSAVTGACLMVERRKFEQVGGFDEAFPVAYNDVDLCLHLLGEGYFNVLASRVRLYHREFATRGNDRASSEKRAALEAALRRLYDKWPWYHDDPMYNPNLSDSFPDFMPRN